MRAEAVERMILIVSMTAIRFNTTRRISRVRLVITRLSTNWVARNTHRTQRFSLGNINAAIRAIVIAQKNIKD